MSRAGKVYRVLQRTLGKEKALNTVIRLFGMDAEEEGVWRTTENGKHYHITKGGRVDKGPNVMKGSNVNDPSTWKAEASKKSESFWKSEPKVFTEKLRNVLEKNGAGFMRETPTAEEWDKAEEEALEKGNPETLYNQYFSEKAVETDWYDQLNDQKFPNLSDEESRFVLDMIESSEGKTLWEKEFGALMNEGDENLKKVYLNIMSKAMNGGYSQGAIENLLHAAKTKIAVAKGAPEIRSSKEYADRIHKIMDKHPDNKDYSTDELRQAGQLTMAEYERRLKAFDENEGFIHAKQENEAANQKCREARDALRAEKKKLEALEFGSPEWEAQEKKVKAVKSEYSAYSKASLDTHEKLEAIKYQKTAICLAESLKTVRGIGVDSEQLNQYVANGEKPTEKHKKFAAFINLLPSDWLRNSMDQGTLELFPLNGEKRANHVGTASGSAISISNRLSRMSTDDLGVCIHEFTHRLEKTEPKLNEIELAFYEQRTRNEELVPLSKLRPGDRYSYDEETRPDHFPDPYCGKYYDDNSREILTMGFQWAYTYPERFKDDKEYRELVYGILTMI